MRRHVQHTAGRTDLITRVAPLGVAAPAACFVPALGEVRFNSTKLLDPAADPARIDPDNGQDRSRHPVLMGAAYHEAAHAAHTRLVMDPAAPARVNELVTCLEEPRIEGRLIGRNPKHREFLRASAQSVLGLADPGQDVPASMRVLVLVEGRRLAGVLAAHETAPVVAACRAEMGDVTVDSALLILADAVMADDGDTAELYRCARLLAELVDDDSDSTDSESGPGGSGEKTPQDGPSGPQDGSGDTDAPTGTPDGDTGPGNGPQQPDGDGSSASQMPCGSWTSGDVPADTDPFASPPAAGPASPEADSRAVEAARDMAREVTEDSLTRLRPRSPQQSVVDDAQRQADANHAQLAATETALAGVDRAKVRLRTYEPSQQLVGETRRLTAILRAAHYRGSDTTLVPNNTPPGKLRVGELMRRDAQQQLGLRITAQPWKARRRTEVDRPRIVVGIAGDVSGSMTVWQRATAHLSYALASAIRVCDGTTAAVAWGPATTLTLRARETPTMVTEAACGGGTSTLPAALRVLDHTLDLTGDTRPVRVVVLVTDCGVSNPVECATEIARLHRAGVKVLLVTDVPNPNWVNVSTLVMPCPTDASGFAAELGAALAALLRSA